MKLAIPSIVETTTVFIPIYETQTLWQKIFMRPKVVALTKPRTITVSVGNCSIETDTELVLHTKFDHKFGTKLYVGIMPFALVRAGRYRCTVDEVIDQT